MTKSDSAAEGSGVDWRDAVSLLRDRRLRILLFACFLHWTTVGAYHLFFPAHVEDLGLSPFVTGSGMALGALAESGVMWWYPKLADRVRPHIVLPAAFGLTALRWWLIAHVRDPSLLVLVQCLHALSFGLFYLTAISSLVEVVPDRLRATGQGLFLASVIGGGGILGHAAAGMIFERWGGAQMFMAACGLSMVAALVATRVRIDRPGLPTEARG
jgi:PPP family 3-phenylpropionic acid transporter